MTQNPKPIQPDPKPAHINRRAQRKRKKDKKRRELRIIKHRKAKGLCENCGKRAPLVDQDGVFDFTTCGQLRHKKSDGSGGELTEENTDWWCYDCHHAEDHSPQWSRKGVGI